MAKIGFIGYGIVGQATAVGFKSGGHKILFHDKFKKSDSLETVILESEFIFICVPTPMFANYQGIDLGIVEDVVNKVTKNILETQNGKKKIVVIKSTVIPGTTARFIKKYPKVSFVVNPEFLTEKNASWEFMHPDRTIIGARDKNSALALKKLHQAILPKNSKFFLTDPTTAEFAKYMSNCYLAAKTMVANEFYALAQKLGINYDEARVMVEADPRVGSHIKVPGPDGYLGFGGKCFPKDMVALLSLGKALKVDFEILQTIWNKNLKIREKYDWKEIEGAVSKG